MGQRWKIEGVGRMKKLVKDTIGHFRVLVEHSLREYEPSPGHILKRMIKPLCRDISRLKANGTKNDAWEVVEGFSQVCKCIKGKTL